MILAPGEESEPREDAEERALSWERLLICRNRSLLSLALLLEAAPLPPPLGALAALFCRLTDPGVRTVACGAYGLKRPSDSGVNGTFLKGGDELRCGD